MRTCPKCQREFVANERICPDDGNLLKEQVPSEEQAIGRTLDGKYRIDGFLKRGGMGSVYRGTHVLLNKPVAVKLIRPELVTSQDIVERFFREARAAAKLSHPNIVTVHDLGQTEDGTLYIIMELVDGKSLKDIIQTGGPWTSARALRFARSVASALSLAHRNGIVHRDLKPQNIMVYRDSEGHESPKLLDFGIAKTLEPDSPALTSTGMVLGTPHYMSSEQAKGMPADQRSDIYALGVILYEMLVGKVPFDDKSIPSILVKHLTEPPRPPSTLKGDIPRDVEKLVLRCLEKDPEKRFQTADDLGKALSALMDTGAHPVLDPTVASTAPLMEQVTIESNPAITRAGGASAAKAVPVPFPPPVPQSDTTKRMESGTMRAHQVSSAPPPRAAAGKSAHLLLGIVFLGGFVLVAAVGAFLVWRFLSGRSVEPTPAVATASTGLADTPSSPPELPETTPPMVTDTTDASDTAATSEPPEPSDPVTVAAQTKREPEVPAAKNPSPPPPPPAPVVEERRVQPTTSAPPPAERVPPAEAPIPEKPAVSVECQGVKDACGVIRVALLVALEKRGMRRGRPGRADVFVNVEAEEIEARSEEQFGNTFVVRTYSVTAEGEVPRFGDTVTIPPRTFSFDARLGAGKLRGE
ncbi:MAG: serine/threonine-protein kinase, partial [Vicinamibacteria bacterium]